MHALRTSIQVAQLAVVASFMLAPGAAQAQLDDRTVVSIIRECRMIVDLSARVACYDNIPIGSTASAPRADSSAALAGSGAGREVRAPPATGFGSRQVSAPEAREPERMTAGVAAVTTLTPGVYVLTLEDGTQWQFVDTVAPTYDPPRPARTVEIAAAALGSYLMTYDGQRAVRVKRVR